MDRVVSVFRRPDGLYALISSRAIPLEEPTPGAGLSPFPDAYTERVTPLAGVPLALLAERDALLAAWNALGQARDADAQALAHAVRLLRDTVADPWAAVADAVPREPRALRPRRSAAHPRAYRGTKHQPRTPRRRRPPNLQAMLCSAGGQARLLRHADFLRSKAHDPGIARSLPPSAQRTLLWPVRALGQRGAGLVLAAYRSLGLDRNEPFRRSISRLLATAPDPERALAWLAAARAQVPERREHFAELVVESDAVEALPTVTVLAQLQRIDGECTDELYRHRMFCSLEALSCDTPLDLYVAGSRLANRFHPEADFNWLWVTQAPDVDRLRTAVEAFMAPLEADADLGDWTRTQYALELWDRGLSLPGFVDVLDLDWSRLDTRSTYRLLDALSDDVKPDAWQGLRSSASEALELLVALPAQRRPEACRSLSRIVGKGAAAKLPTLLRRWFEFMAVAAQPGFPRTFSSTPTQQLMGVDAESWRKVLAAPPERFRALERCAERQNDERLVAWGLGSMIDVLPSAVATWFADSAGSLGKAAKTLGALSEPERRRVLRGLGDHPLWGERAGKLGLAELVRQVASLRPPDGANPIRRRLREHFAGNTRLRPQQLDVERRRLLGAVPRLLLETLRARVHERLAEGIPRLPLHERSRHALMIQRFADVNRRGLRKAIRRYALGDHTYLQRHPLNARWLAHHLPNPRQRAGWLDGVRLVRRTSLGRVTLRVERDPLEALRLGTYAGSCLGLGGAYARSAAAIVLDVNKQVVYARRRGEVIGRQVVALSNAGRLVGYEVYGLETTTLQPLFKEYDLALAAALRVCIHSPGDDDDDVALLLAKRWWNDGAWDVLASSS